MDCICLLLSLPGNFWLDNSFTLLGARYYFIPSNISELCCEPWLGYLGRVWFFEGSLVSFGRQNQSTFNLPHYWGSTIGSTHWLLGTLTIWGPIWAPRIVLLLTSRVLFLCSEFPHMHVLISTHMKIWGEPRVSPELYFSLCSSLSSLVFCPADSLWPPQILNSVSSTLFGLLLLPPWTMACKLFPGSKFGQF